MRLHNVRTEREREIVETYAVNNKGTLGESGVCRS